MKTVCNPSAIGNLDLDGVSCVCVCVFVSANRQPVRDAQMTVDSRCDEWESEHSLLNSHRDWLWSSVRRTNNAHFRNETQWRMAVDKTTEIYLWLFEASNGLNMLEIQYWNVPSCHQPSQTHHTACMDICVVDGMCAAANSQHTTLNHFTRDGTRTRRTVNAHTAANTSPTSP